MMEISIIKDLFRGTPHVIVTKSDSHIFAKPVTEFGTPIAKSIAALGSIDHKSLPDGFAATDFKHVSDEMASIVVESYISPELEHQALLAKITKPQLAKSRNERNILNRTSASRAPSMMPIRKATSADAKLNLIDYKASKFKTTNRLGSVVSTIKHNQIGFDSRRNLLVAKKSNPFGEVVIEQIIKSVGGGAIRRFMQQVEGKALGTEVVSRRSNRRAVSIRNQEATGIDSVLHSDPFVTPLLSRLRRV